MFVQSMQASNLHDDMAQIRNYFLALKENFVRIPDALKGRLKLLIRSNSGRCSEATKFIT